jgi:hypothetical protein
LSVRQTGILPVSSEDNRPQARWAHRLQAYVP